MNDLHLKQRVFEGFMIVVLLLAVFAFIYIVATHKKTAEPYCQQFANTAARDLPAQCIRYWQ